MSSPIYQFYLNSFHFGHAYYSPESLGLCVQCFCSTTSLSSLHLEVWICYLCYILPLSASFDFLIMGYHVNNTQCLLSHSFHTILVHAVFFTLSSNITPVTVLEHFTSKTPTLLIHPCNIIYASHLYRTLEQLFPQIKTSPNRLSCAYTSLSKPLKFIITLLMSWYQ